jgi:hypothetical protein
MHRHHWSVLILVAVLATLASGRVAAQTAPPAAAPPSPPVSPTSPPAAPTPPPAAQPAPAPSAPSDPTAPASPAAPSAAPDGAAMPAPGMPVPAETTIPAPVETKPVEVPTLESPTPVVAASGAPPSRRRVGFTLGIVSLPRPIELEATFRALPTLAVSAQYSMLPDLTAPGGSASLRLRAYQGVARWFPFSGSFFVGSGLGFQTFRASLTKTVDNGTLVTTVDLSGVFVSPQLGWLFVWRSGFALGLNVGVQIPLPKDPVATSTYEGQPVPSQPGAGFSQEVVNKSNSSKDTVQTLGKLANKYPIPNIDLLRLGFFF